MTDVTAEHAPERTAARSAFDAAAMAARVAKRRAAEWRFQAYGIAAISFGLFCVLMLFGVIISKVTIGRSFGIAPANRGVVARGPYNIVRHPIYAGYLLTHGAALVAYPSVWNVIVVVGGDIALVLRALAEERVLIADREYQAYCGRVAWHLVPGVF